MRKIANLLAIIIICCFAVSVSYAKKYSEDPAGQGVSTVGVGGDYASLWEAAMDFNTTANTGNWTILILNSLNEDSNVYFGNTVGNNTVILKPAPGVTNCTVTFLYTGIPAGYSGHLIIGAKGGEAIDTTYPPIKVDNFIIDGSNDGSGSRDLTFVNLSSDSDSVRIIRVVGDCDNVQIKNCNIINRRNTGTGSYFGLDFTSRYFGGVSYIPDNWVVENCYIESTSSVAAQAIQASAFGTPPAGNAQTGWRIERCFIVGRSRGIFLNQSAGGTIANNTIRVIQPSSGYLSQAIFHNSCNGTSGWTIDIYGNVIDKLLTGNVSAGSCGIMAMELTGAASAPATATYNVYNNMISGFELVGAGASVGFWVTGISSGSVVPVLNIFYNSINMPGFENFTGFTADSCHAIGVRASGYTGTARIKNNIIRIAQSGGAAIFKRNSTGLDFNYNNLVPTSGAAFGRYITTNYVTLPDWQNATGQDLNSQCVDPTTTSPGAWASATDLHFTGGKPIPMKPGIPITSPFPITTDIDGDTRHSSAPYPGADEVPGVPLSYYISEPIGIITTGEYIFQMGSESGDEYTPLILNVTSLSAADTITVSLTDSKHPNRPTEYFVSRYYSINQSGNASITADITLSYTSADSTDANLEGEATNVDVAKWDGSSWSYITPAERGYNSEANVYTVKVTGITSLSDWTVSGPQGVPVELSNFEAIPGKKE